MWIVYILLSALCIQHGEHASTNTSALTTHDYILKSVHVCLKDPQNEDIIHMLRHTLACNRRKWRSCGRNSEIQKNDGSHINTSFPCEKIAFNTEDQRYIKFEINVHKPFQLNVTFLKLHLPHSGIHCYRQYVKVVSTFYSENYFPDSLNFEEQFLYTLPYYVYLHKLITKQLLNVRSSSVLQVDV